jgi:Asp-tRNA(Asn)/Glu-tRNA(Gln) amidotransferase A subunit family amidase
MTATELHFITVAEAARRIARRELSPVELTEAYLQRIDAFDDQLQSFVTLTADRARQQAKTAETEIMRDGSRSPLHGIPYCLKDIVETAGIRTTGQSKLLANHIPAQDAVVAAKLRDGGGILLGKTATWEFAHGGPSWDVLFPPARNPWNTAHHPAGSSSGSGAAVAAGFAPATIGSDTGGSIRGPAAACGIAGLKPTYGLVSRRGVLPCRGLCSGDASASRPRDGNAADLQDDRPDDAANRRAGRQIGAGAALLAIHRPVLHDGIQRQRQSGVFGVQRLRRERYAAIFADRRPAV